MADDYTYILSGAHAYVVELVIVVHCGKEQPLFMVFKENDERNRWQFLDVISLFPDEDVDVLKEAKELLTDILPEFIGCMHQLHVERLTEPKFCNDNMLTRYETVVLYLGTPVPSKTIKKLAVIEPQKQRDVALAAFVPANKMPMYAINSLTDWNTHLFMNLRLDEHNKAFLFTTAEQPCRTCSREEEEEEVKK